MHVWQKHSEGKSLLYIIVLVSPSAPSYIQNPERLAKLLYMIHSIYTFILQCVLMICLFWTHVSTSLGSLRLGSGPTTTQTALVTLANNSASKKLSVSMLLDLAVAVNTAQDANGASLTAQAELLLGFNSFLDSGFKAICSAGSPRALFLDLCLFFGI